MSAAELAILAEVRALRAEVQELRELCADTARHMLEGDDRRIGKVLVPLLAKAFPNGQFTVAGVMALALDESTLTGQVLCKLIGDRLQEDGGRHVLGRLLARLDGVQFKRCRLVAAGEERGVKVWRVSTPSKPAARDTQHEISESDAR